MESIITWVQTIAFPALSSCFEFLKNSISDIINVMFGSRLVFFFSLFLIGTVIATLVSIFIKAPDISSYCSYPQYSLIKPRDLYSSLSAGVAGRGFKLGRYFSNKKKVNEFFKNNPSFIYMTKDGFKFFSKDWNKKKFGGSSNNNKYKAIERHYFAANKTSNSKERNIDISAD